MSNIVYSKIFERDWRRNRDRPNQNKSESMLHNHKQPRNHSNHHQQVTRLEITNNPKMPNKIYEKLYLNIEKYIFSGECIVLVHTYDKKIRQTFKTKLIPLWWFTNQIETEEKPIHTDAGGVNIMQKL